MGLLIGFTGKAGSGKDTAADYLKTIQNFGTVAFADPIRKMLVASGAVTIEQLVDRALKEQVIPEFGKAPRNMAQTLGTEWARERVHPDFWLILAGKRIDELHALGFDVAVTDVRFDNEAEYIRNRGGLIVHITRGEAGTPHNHASEAGITSDLRDYIIDNNGSKVELYDQLYSMLEYADGLDV